MDLAEWDRRLAKRRQELGLVGNDFAPRNDGSRRTESKRQLLRAIAEARATDGVAPTDGRLGGQGAATTDR